MVRKVTIGRIMLAGLIVFGMLFASSCNNEHGGPIRVRGDKIRVVVVTGGHGFDEKPFRDVFNSFGDVDCTFANQADDSELFEDISEWNYDVIVLYNMSQKITPKRQQNYIKLLNRGVGVISMHHAIAAWQQWETYPKIIGAKFYLNETKEGDVVHAPSKYKDDVDIDVHVEDLTHPITKGMKDFRILDETYKNSSFEKDNHVLLSTEEETNDEALCWVRKYGKGRVCYIQFGHNAAAYTNMNYRLLVGRAIRWCGRTLN